MHKLRSLLKALFNQGRLSELFRQLEPHHKNFLAHCWPLWARDNQISPSGAWTNWLLLGGRGAGKTRTGAEWVRMVATRPRNADEINGRRIALVGETYLDAMDVMIEGTSGLLAVHHTSERPTWKRSRRLLEWKNGAIAQIFSSEDPDGLRGPQFAAAWSDELAKWRYPVDTWDMLQFGLRVGDYPRQMVTTTPRPIALLKDMIADPQTVSTRMPTRENADNLARSFLDKIVSRYQGSRLGRQELDGEIIEDRPDALWQRNEIERQRVSAPPELRRIVVAIDPPITAHAKSDACGLICAGLGINNRVYVLADKTRRCVSPTQWAKAAIELYHQYEADCILVETNQGGDMAETVIRSVEKTLPIRQVKASRSKWLRAEPVAALYEQGEVTHAGNFPELEDEMCSFGLDGLSSGHSPDRLDALVWAVSELLLAENKTPRIRRF